MEKKLLEIDNCIQCNYHYSIDEDNFCCFKRNRKIKKIADGIPSWCKLPSIKHMCKICKHFFCLW